MTGGSAGASLGNDAGGAATHDPDSGALRHIDWIWTVRGSVALPPGLGGEAAFDRLAPLFDAPGTSHERQGETLTFRKKDAAAQDKLAVYDSGTLQMAAGEAGPVLRYRLISRALLFCFVLPLLFLGFAQLAIHLGKAEPPKDEAAAAGKAGGKPSKPEPELKLNPIDELLGAPAPESKKDKEKKKKDNKDEKPEKKPSPTPAYVFAGLFAALYVIGRFLEPWLVARLFRRRLWDDAAAT